MLKPNPLMKCDAWINALMIPSGHNFQVQNVFRRSSFLRTESKLKWLINLVDFTVSAFPAEYPSAYKEFLSMLSFDFSVLYSPVIYEDDISMLYNYFVETTATHEGIFPESESSVTLFSVPAKIVPKYCS